MTDFALPHANRDLSIDQQVALRTAAGDLGREFAGVYGPETIERFLHSSYEQFATISCVPNFLPAAITAMAERGIDITGEYPKPWTHEVVRAADVVITVGCGDACPIFSGTRYENWDLDDPAGLDVAAVRQIRDDPERRVRELIAQLTIPAAKQ